MKRPIHDESDNLAFSETFRPVDSVIKMCDHKKTTMLSVWNDRPQAGAVHDDGTMKLLIDRRTKLQDLASLGSMVMDREDDLVLNFRVKMSPYEETSPSCAQRERSLLGVQSRSFAAMKSLAHRHADEYKKHQAELVQALSAMNVEQYALTRLPTSGQSEETAFRVRVRLDLSERQAVDERSGQSLMVRDLRDSIGDIAKSVCGLIVWD